MRYEKPQIVSCASAKKAIAGSHDKSRPVAIDANPLLGDTATHAAYEADE